MAKREIAERIDGELTVEASTPCPKIADAGRDLDATLDRGAARSLVLSISDFPTTKPPRARAPASVPLADEQRAADFRLVKAVPVPVEASLEGAAPRGIEGAQAAVYFARSEAIQDVATHAGRAAQIEFGLHHNRGTVAVRIADDGRGFDPARTPYDAGLRNIRERVQPLGGTLRLTSTSRHGTVLTISPP